MSGFSEAADTIAAGFAINACERAPPNTEEVIINEVTNEIPLFIILFLSV